MNGSPDELALLQLLHGCSAATVYEAIGKRGEVGPDILPLVPGRPLLGVAYTVRCPLGDTRAVWESIAQAPPGSVVVIDCGGTRHATSVGGTSARAALLRGLAGFVTNGAIRDVAEIRSLELPVFAAGTSVRGTAKLRPGSHQVPVSIGHAVVSPGDLLVGDDDGLVVIERAFFSELPKLLEAQIARETELEMRVDAGEDVRDIFNLR